MNKTTFFKFPEDLPEFDPHFNYENLETSFLKLKGYVNRFNDLLNDTDVGEDWLREDDWKNYLDTLKSSIIFMKKDLGINEKIQPYYF